MRVYYKDSDCTIYHGDCREALDDGFDLGPVDLVHTDPPYGLRMDVQMERRAAQGRSMSYGEATDWDIKPDDDLLQRLIAVGNHAIVWGGNYFSLAPSPCWLVWDKENGDYSFADCELAWTNFECAVRKCTWQWMSTKTGDKNVKRVHPTQKPVPVMKWATQFLPGIKPGMTVFDPFLGSGAIAEAARLLGMNSIGIEREEKYCEMAAQRMSQQRLPFGGAYENVRKASTRGVAPPLELFGAGEANS